MPPKQDVLDREAEVIKLRRGGLTWDLIAQRVGYRHPSSALDAFNRANARIIRDDVEAIRQVEQDRLDIAQSAIWSKVLQGDTNAVSTLIRLMERRAKLLGLDQPVRIQAEVITYDANSINTELARIIELANSGKALPVGEPASQTDPVTD